MSAAPEVVRAVTAPGATAHLPATPARSAAPGLSRRLVVRLGNEWLPRVAWTLGRTGRAGLVGIALLLAAALFLLSTYLRVAAEVEALRADLPAAQRQPHSAGTEKVADPATAMRALPARADMPAVLRQLFNEATQARLAVDTAKYDVSATRSGALVRYQIAFPVTGPYPHIRAFIDATLATMPAVALSDLALERKSIADGNVEAQLRMTVYTVATGTTGPGAGSATAGPGRQGSPRAAATAAAPQGAPGAERGFAAGADLELARAQAQPRVPEARPASNRVVAPTHASALFAQHSWYVLPPAPPPAPPPPPPDPTAPPFPYTFVGSYAPGGEPPVFFLTRGDRVIDAHVGDRLDGVYQLESAAGGQLVFVYLPLNIRQTLAAGVSK